MTALFGPIDAIEQARALREAGASGVFTFEGPHDVFAPLTLASTVGGLDLMTNVAIAFPAQPDSARAPGDRPPAAQRGPIRARAGHADPHADREAVRRGVRQAGGADDRAGRRRCGPSSHAWETGERLDFRGEYYRHTLMTPTFSPGENPVRPAADLRRCAGPAAHPGHRRARRRPAGHAVRQQAVPARGDDARRARGPGRGGASRPRTSPSSRRSSCRSGDDHTATRRLLAFYGSTPAYRPVLDIHGWGDLQPELNALSKQGRWEEMGAAHRRRRAAHHRRLRHRRRGRRAHSGPGRRHIRPDLPVPAGSRSRRRRWPRSLTRCEG